MKALTLDNAEAHDLVRRGKAGLIRKRSVPREIIGQRVVIHAKATKLCPALGIGIVIFGEAIPLLNGQLLWPVTFAEEWETKYPAHGRAGFWEWNR